LGDGFSGIEVGIFGDQLLVFFVPAGLGVRYFLALDLKFPDQAPGMKIGGFRFRLRDFHMAFDLRSSSVS